MAKEDPGTPFSNEQQIPGISMDDKRDTEDKVTQGDAHMKRDGLRDTEDKAKEVPEASN